jgi:peptidoglycan hydrolase-like protein with peptidoglycan-binding domain
VIDMQRRTLAVLVVGAVILASLVTWVASARIRSPAEAAARTAPPEPSAILVKVERRVLATKVIGRGTGQYGSPLDLAVVGSVLKSGQKVMTRRPVVGAVLHEGALVLTISGRPTFLLNGTQPSYRDIGPDMSGSDVRQLESGLKRSGFDPGPVDGYYDWATGEAVSALYRRHGFEPIVATSEQLDAVRPTEADLVRGAHAGGGVQVPADEIIFVPRTPLRVTKAPVALGAPAEGALATVTDSVVSVDGALPLDQAGLVKVGSQVLIDEPALGINQAGTVTHVAQQPGTEGADGFHVAFRVLAPKAPPALVGASVRLTVLIQSTRKAELTVPVSAVSLAPDGASRVQRSVGGRVEYLTVRPGLSADGFVAVTPGGNLAEGDLVVVGVTKGG